MDIIVILWGMICGWAYLLFYNRGLGQHNNILWAQHETSYLHLWDFMDIKHATMFDCDFTRDGVLIFEIILGFSYKLTTGRRRRYIFIYNVNISTGQRGKISQRVKNNGGQQASFEENGQVLVKDELDLHVLI